MVVLLAVLLAQTAPAPQDEVRGCAVLKTKSTDGSVEIRVGGSAQVDRGSALPVVDSKIPGLKGSKLWTWDDERGLLLHLRKLPPGVHLVTIAWFLQGPPSATEDTSIPTHYVASTWLNIKAPEDGQSVPEFVLTVEPSVSGTVEVQAGSGLEAGSISFLPADDEGKIPHWDLYRTGPCFSEKVAEGKAVFKGMKPGKYVFYPTREAVARGLPPATVTAEVRANAITRVTLAPERK
jgi:hypothetical protein